MNSCGLTILFSSLTKIIAVAWGPAQSSFICCSFEPFSLNQRCSELNVNMLV